MELTNTKVYTMRNDANGVTITCTSKYLAHWIARGFRVVKIVCNDQNKLDKLSGEHVTQ